MFIEYVSLVKILGVTVVNNCTFFYLKFVVQNQKMFKLTQRIILAFLLRGRDLE